LGFGVVTVDSGAAWTLTGSSTIGSGVTPTDLGTVTGGTVVSGGIELVCRGRRCDCDDGHRRRSSGRLGQRQ
jgi:hypothetical protein